MSLLALLAFACAAAPLARGPHIVDASSTSARICWRTAQRRDAGKNPASAASEVMGAADVCDLWEDLPPGKEFVYSVPGAGEFRARTLPPSGRPLRLAVVGDMGQGGEAQRRVAAVLERWAPDLILAAGDIVYPSGRDSDYDARFFRPYARLLSRVPFFPAAGNHDYGNSGRLEKGRRRFADGWGRVFRRPPYYSFDAGDVHVAVLDTNNEGAGIAAAEPVAPRSAQLAWLEADLAASRAAWKFALMHVPLYSSGKHRGRGAVSAALRPVLEKARVDAAFQGHDHNYERTEPLGGTLYFVVGTGGAGLRGRGREEAWSAKFLSEHGFLGVTVEGRSALFEFYDADGRLRDSHRVHKQPYPIIPP